MAYDFLQKVEIRFFFLFLSKWPMEEFTESFPSSSVHLASLSSTSFWRWITASKTDLREKSRVGELSSTWGRAWKDLMCQEHVAHYIRQERQRHWDKDSGQCGWEISVRVGEGGFSKAGDYGKSPLNTWDRHKLS